MAEEAQATSGTYEASCHCGYIKFAVTLRPALSEYEVLQCNCSVCRRMGYLLVYPDLKDVVWHGDSRARCASYRFNTKRKDQMFCPKCGASLGIDFSDIPERKETRSYGISARTFFDIDLDKLRYKKLDGVQAVSPAGDLAGMWYEEDQREKTTGKVE